ncbi:39_t:CDS:2, partial [Gigaspora margarita]
PQKRGTNCTDAEWDEILEMGIVSSNETPTEWVNRIWPRLQYFRENVLLPSNSRKYFEARKLIRLPNSGSYAPEIGIAICFSCDQLVYTGQRKKNIGNYNHIGMERHWKFSCTGNKYCGVSYDEYLLKVEKKSISGYDYNNEYALHRYGLWMQNAIRKIERARAVGRKIRACTIMQRKVVEWIYRPEGLTAQELALHYACLQNIRTEMRQ